MAWDFPVEGRLFITALVVIFFAPLFAAVLASVVDPGDPNSEFDWYGTLAVAAGVLLILSAIYGRNPEERTQAGQPELE
jgi:drug/metabolite transporter (DMT)-like permease